MTDLAGNVVVAAVGVVVDGGDGVTVVDKLHAIQIPHLECVVVSNQKLISKNSKENVRHVTPSESFFFSPLPPSLSLSYLSGLQTHKLSLGMSTLLVLCWCVSVCMKGG